MHAHVQRVLLVLTKNIFVRITRCLVRLRAHRKRKIATTIVLMAGSLFLSQDIAVVEAAKLEDIDPETVPQIYAEAVKDFAAAPEVSTHPRLGRKFIVVPWPGWIACQGG